MLIFRRRLFMNCLIFSTMAQIRTIGCKDSVCKRLGVVIGHEEKENQVIVCYSKVTPPSQHVVYFGGDVQDYKENMELYNPQYAEWDLETTALLLQSRFKDSTVFVIKPSHMLLNTFSMYHNFLYLDEDGKPDFSNTFGAFLQLVKIYENAKKMAASVLTDKEENQSSTCKSRESMCGDDLPVKLVGFSKGCVVINQLMFELDTMKVLPEVKQFLNNLSSIYWLDGGHIGGKDAYITNDELLKSIASLEKDLVVHVSPYQVKDINRPWIGKEEKRFVSKLKDLNAGIKEYQHYMDEQPSIGNHWKILTKV